MVMVVFTKQKRMKGICLPFCWWQSPNSLSSLLNVNIEISIFVVLMFCNLFPQKFRIELQKTAFRFFDT